MPLYAKLIARIPCPRCGQEIKEADSMVKFQWGALPKGYSLGQKICWSSGWLKRRRWMIGLPSVHDVLLIDSDGNMSEWSCQNCGTLLDKPCVEVREGKIKGVWLFERGGFKLKTGYDQDGTDYFQLGPTDELVSLPEFDLVAIDGKT